MNSKLSILWFSVKFMYGCKRGRKMAQIYAMSDIHGCLQPLLDMLSLVNLESDKENKLVVVLIVS